MKAARHSSETISPSMSNLFSALGTAIVLASQSCFFMSCPTYVWARVYFGLQRFMTYSFSTGLEPPLFCAAYGRREWSAFCWVYFLSALLDPSTQVLSTSFYDLFSLEVSKSSLMMFKMPLRA